MREKTLVRSVRFEASARQLQPHDFAHGPDEFLITRCSGEQPETIAEPPEITRFVMRMSPIGETRFFFGKKGTVR
jgi:hypothetical protein